MIYAVLPLTVGFLADCLFGDPHHMPHIVRWCGALITLTEKVLRDVFPATEMGEKTAGCVLVLTVTGICTLLPFYLLNALPFWPRIILASFLCYQLLASKSLRDETLPVYDALEQSDLPGARKAVSMVVGRDVNSLDEAGVTRAAIETVAENAADGVAAPLMFIALFGVCGGCFYKAVNTLDSMVGYRNRRYRYFGTCSARLDDIAGFIPARLAGVFFILSAFFTGDSVSGALKVFLRDRKKHASPNSAHTEAAVAGAIGVRLAGPAVYFGEIHEKPYLNEHGREAVPADILRSHRLLQVFSLLFFLFALVVSLFVKNFIYGEFL